MSALTEWGKNHGTLCQNDLHRFDAVGGIVRRDTGRGWQLRWRVDVRIASSNPACGSGANVSIGINNGQVASGNAMMAASAASRRPAASA